jgi:peptidoglycan/LPS O-acetylase OafA/YrhL
LSGNEETGTAKIHSDRRMPSITGLRIFAALAVYASHIGPPQGAPTAIVSFFDAGYCGVTVFFVLSGFVLAFNYFDEFRRPRPTSIYNFFVGRLARIYPLYLLILFYLLIRQHTLVGGIPDWWWQHTLAIQAWDDSVSHAYAFNGPAWSISVEFFLYACFPFLIPLVGRLRSRRELFLAAGAVTIVMAALVIWFVTTGKGGLSWADPASAHRWLYRTPLMRLGDFTLGILAARLFVQTREIRVAKATGRWLAPLAAVTIMALMAWPSLLFSAWSWDLAYALPAVALIFGLVVAPSGWLSRALSVPAIVLLGEASYAFYLVHVPAISLLGAGQWGRQPFSLSMLTLETLNLAAIVALAIGLHLGVEHPTRRYLRRRFSRTAGGSVAADRAARLPSTP